MYFCLTFFAYVWVYLFLLGLGLTNRVLSLKNISVECTTDSECEDGKICVDGRCHLCKECKTCTNSQKRVTIGWAHRRTCVPRDFTCGGKICAHGETCVTMKKGLSVKPPKCVPKTSFCGDDICEKNEICTTSGSGKNGPKCYRKQDLCGCDVCKSSETCVVSPSNLGPNHVCAPRALVCGGTICKSYEECRTESYSTGKRSICISKEAICKQACSKEETCMFVDKAPKCVNTKSICGHKRCGLVCHTGEKCMKEENACEGEFCCNTFKCHPSNAWTMRKRRWIVSTFIK